MTSRVDNTLERLIDMITKLGVGSNIPPQDQLARQFQVSRTVIREAISKLEFLNVIRVRPKLGTTILPTAHWKTHNHEVIAWKVRLVEADIQAEVV
jgi:DNA-binding FadR family transcriptional regulator